MPPNQLLQDVTQLQNMLVSRATGGGANDWEYRELREKLINDPSVCDLLPDFVHLCRDLDQFWAFIKQTASQYQPRRDFLWDAFRPLLQAAEKGVGAPVQEVASETLDKLDASHVGKLWRKALARAEKDPEGAITAARSLVESVCKLVLDALGAEYDAEADLPKLYKTAAKNLNLGVDQHQQQVFKQILSGIGTVVEGFAAVRNKLGDAHGQGSKPVKPAPRHAHLAVNLAGTLAVFVVQTFEHMYGDGLASTKTPEPAADDEPLF